MQKHVKIIFSVCIIICVFVSGYFSGCAGTDKGAIEKQLAQITADNQQLEQINRDLTGTITEYESQLERYRDNQSGLERINRELQENNKRIRANYTELQAEITRASGYTEEAERIVKECLEELEKKSN